LLGNVGTSPIARVQLLDESNKTFTANVDDIVVDQTAGQVADPAVRSAGSLKPLGLPGDASSSLTRQSCSCGPRATGGHKYRLLSGVPGPHQLHAVGAPGLSFRPSRVLAGSHLNLR
jgi:hypothetical protein